ncbi:MAG: NAD(P)-dependent oxidoreductase [Nitrospirota bacterium]|nr:NAD(P)-dependent oxidoreductase [Nitrospirota bacterium]
MKRLKVLVTGSKGLIGRILTENLSDHFDIYGLDKNSGGAKHFKADAYNYSDLDSVFSRLVSVDCIVHLAGDSRVDADWESVLRNNIVGTRNIYECAKKHGIRKVVFASSSHVTGAYENSHSLTIHDPIRPDSDYGSSKAFGEIIARQYADLYGIKSICLRIGWVMDDDDPTKNELSLKMWLSHRDLVALMRRSILADIDFGVYYGVSNNRERFWNISNAEKEIGYKPKDDAYSLMSRSFSFKPIADKLKKQIRKYLDRRKRQYFF